MDRINVYGDILSPTQKGHGVDIASQRQDDLDLQSLSYISSQKAYTPIIALDLGGGYGAHSIRMALAGAAVTMVDVADMASDKFSEAIQAGDIEPNALNFIKKDFAVLGNNEIPSNLNLVYSQRAIHYLPYGTAQKILRNIYNGMVNNSPIFISAAGYDTEYGRTYPDRNKSIQDRFNYVSPDMQAKHSITKKIVTYTKEDMDLFLTQIGFRIKSVAVSPFGNIKAVAFKPDY